MIVYDDTWPNEMRQDRTRLKQNNTQYLLLFTLNNLNRLQIGLYFIGIGTLVALFFIYENKKYVNNGFKMFGENIRKKEQSILQQILFVELGTRSKLGIYFGYFFIIAGIMKIIAYFFK